MKQLVILLSLVSFAVCGQAPFSIVNFAPEKIAPLQTPFPMAPIALPAIPAQDFKLTDYGLRQAPMERIDSALHAALRASAIRGGGRIIIPAGTWLSGPIVLPGKTELHLEEGAEVYFSTNLSEYLPGVFSRHQGIECYKFKPMIYARDVEDIAVTGRGTFHGQGKAWWRYNDRRQKAWKTLQGMAENDVDVTERIFADTVDHFLAPSFVQPINCKNVLIDGPTFKYGPFWTVNPVYCENVIIRRVTVETIGSYGHTRNGDGINPSSCKNVLIEYCDLDTGDDCITIKSGRAHDGLRVGMPAENVVVRYCQARRGHGGVVIGSETSGGIRNVFISNCNFTDTDRGIRIKTARERGAYVENIFVEDITMRNIVEEAIIVNMLRYTPRYPEFPVTDRTPRYQNIRIKNIRCDGARYGLRLIGLPEKPMKSLSVTGLDFRGMRGVEIRDASGVELTDVQLNLSTSYGLELDHANDVTFANVALNDGANVHLKEGNKQIQFSNCAFTKRAHWMINNGTEATEILIP